MLPPSSMSYAVRRNSNDNEAISTAVGSRDCAISGIEENVSTISTSTDIGTSTSASVSSAIFASAASSSSAIATANAEATTSAITRPTLPDRNVIPETIEDAYVRFIFYCNPFLPPLTDTQNLREAFRNPPRSGGKLFKVFNVYELVRKFHAKEIRTWTELTIRLGVKPPDLTKDESAQKIAQYGVRLKKWMISMHVKAFFEYLMGIPNDYWTAIPTDHSPTARSIRDGIAIEDDMALRALLPHVRPKRGRKRPGEDDKSASPAQRLRLSPASCSEEQRQVESRVWPGHHDGRALLSGDAATRSSTSSTTTNESGWFCSAATPNTSICTSTGTKISFWDDALKAGTVTTPSKPKPPNQRWGPKNVSSAWRSGSVDSGARTRGRPPICRTPTENAYPQLSPHPSSASPIEADTYRHPYDYINDQAGPVIFQGGRPVEQYLYQPVPVSPQTANNDDASRLNKPDIYLQAPERPATSTGTFDRSSADISPGQRNTCQIWEKELQPTDSANPDRTPSQNAQLDEGLNRPVPPRRNVSAFYFERIDDRTNIDEVIAFMARNAYVTKWLDADGNDSYRPSMAECIALVNLTLETMYKSSDSENTFLINLAAMTGGRLLLTNDADITRVSEQGGKTRYFCRWQYAFGPIKGEYTMDQDVPHRLFRDMGPGQPSTSEERQAKADGEHEGPLTAEEWQEKYNRLVIALNRKDWHLFSAQQNLFRFKAPTPPPGFVG